MEAAFFDLDKTVIARASMVAFGRPLYREGLVSRALLLRALWGQLVYLHLGADEARLARMRAATLALTRGWHRDRVTEIVEAALAEVVEPIIYEEALDLLRAHRDAGRYVVIVSAAPASPSSGPAAPVSDTAGPIRSHNVAPPASPRPSALTTTVMPMSSISSSTPETQAAASPLPPSSTSHDPTIHGFRSGWLRSQQHAGYWLA